MRGLGSIEVVKHGPLYRGQATLSLPPWPRSPWATPFMASSRLVTAWSRSYNGAAKRVRKKADEVKGWDQAWRERRARKTRRFPS